MVLLTRRRGTNAPRVQTAARACRRSDRGTGSRDTSLPGDNKKHTHVMYNSSNYTYRLRCIHIDSEHTVIRVARDLTTDHCPSVGV